MQQTNVASTNYSVRRRAVISALNQNRRVATDLLQHILVIFTGDMTVHNLKGMVMEMEGDEEDEEDYGCVYVGICCSANPSLIGSTPN